MFSYISYIYTKQELKETCFNLFSWTGTFSVIIAYFMTSFEIEEYIIIDCLNIYGSFSIGYTCWDCSKDSRFLSEVGYVHKNNLVGKAQILFFSSDPKIGSIFKFWQWDEIMRFKRFFNKIK